MKHFFWILFFITIPSGSFAKEPSLIEKGAVLFVAIENATPRVYENMKEALGKKFRKIIVNKTTKEGNNFFHLAAGVRDYQNYFVIEMIAAIRQLSFYDIKDLFFEKNSDDLTPLQVAESANNQKAFDVLSKLKNEIENQRLIREKHKGIQVDVYTFTGVGFVFTMNGTFLAMTGWEGPGGLPVGLASFTVALSVCYPVFKKIRSWKELSQQLVITNL